VYSLKNIEGLSFLRNRFGRESEKD